MLLAVSSPSSSAIVCNLAHFSCVFLSIRRAMPEYRCQGKNKPMYASHAFAFHSFLVKSHKERSGGYASVATRFDIF